MLTFEVPWRKKRVTMKGFRHSPAAALAVFAILLVWAGAAYAAGPAMPSLSDGGGDEPWTITCDLLEHSDAPDVYTATGNVTAERAGRRLAAEKVVWDRDKATLWAQGAVSVRSGSDTLTGESVDMDIGAETGRAEGAVLFVGAKKLTVRAREIRKVGPADYTLAHGSVTACNREHPHWRITASKVVLAIEGYGHADNALLWMGGVPVIYTPYLFFPVKTQRATGLLAPQFGRSSRKGFFLEQPLFIAPSDSWDMTLYENYMEKRGNQVGAELRIIPDAGSKIWLYGTWLADRQVDYGSGVWGYLGDDYPRTNTGRYWLAGMYDKAFADGARVKADLDFVSDQDYLREFKSGFIGFDAVNKSLLARFSRNIDDYDATVRHNRLFVTRSFDTAEVCGGVLWQDDIIARNFAVADSTPQKLPYARFGLGREPLFSGRALPLTGEFSAEAANFYRDEPAKGSRIIAQPRVSLPLLLGGAVLVEPSAAWRQSAYFTESFPGSAAESQAQSGVFEGDFRISTELSRDFDARLWGASRLRHVVFTTLALSHVPETDDERLPYFDADDRVNPQDLVTLTVVNHLLGRIGEGSPAAVRSMAYLSLSESYDIREAQEDNPAKWAVPGEQRPFSPVQARLELYPSEKLYGFAEARFSPYDKAVTYAALGTTALFDGGHKLSASYTKTRDVSEYVALTADIKVLPKFTLYGRYQRDLYADARVETVAGVIYEEDCWSLDVGYTDEPGEQQYTIRVTLKGLGGVGGSFNPFN